MNSEKLKKARKKMRLSQKDVAKKLGISRSMYTLIENGNRNPSIKVLKKMINVFGDQINDIFFNN